MKTFRKPLPALESSYSLDGICNIEDTVFLDIETTGFTARTSQLYLIGCITYENHEFVSHQWFCEQPEDEKVLLESFATFMKSYHFLIHYNGNHFDIPYLNDKMKQFQISYTLDGIQGLDLYKRIAPYKDFLKLPNCKQKTIETYLGVIRDDVLAGDELIPVYYHYISDPTEYELELLLLHNAEDILGMVRLLPILSYVDLMNQPLIVTRVQADYYNDYMGNPAQELIMKIKLPSALPIQLSAYANQCYFTGFEQTGTLKVPIYHTELKYFYSNYKDYYYLPAEDVALHKSVASFVDKEHRMKATAANCYTRKQSDYLPEWDILVEPFFKEEYKSKKLYFELTDELKQDRSLFSQYATHILKMIYSEQK